MWYGIKYSPNSRINYIRKIRRTSLRIRILSFLIPSYKTISLGFSSIYVPYGWSLNILTPNGKNNFKLLYLYSNSYYFNLPVPSQFSVIRFDSQASVLHLNYWLVCNHFYLYTKLISFIFYSFSRIFFIKLRFKGKGYYIYKNKRNTITPQFGHSHRIYLYTSFVSVYFLSKVSIFIFGLSKHDVFKASVKVRNLKPINIFTGRGVRFTRQVIYRKVGKVSSYR